MLIVTYLSHTYNNYDITIGKSGEGEQTCIKLQHTLYDIIVAHIDMILWTRKNLLLIYLLIKYVKQIVQ